MSESKSILECEAAEFPKRGDEYLTGRHLGTMALWLVTSAVAMVALSLIVPRSATAISTGDLLVAGYLNCPLSPDSASILRVDPVTGDRSVISGWNEDCTAIVGTGSAYTDIEGMTVAPDGFIMVGDGDGGDAGRLIRVNPVTGDNTVLSGCLDPVDFSTCGAGGIILGPGPLLPGIPAMSVVSASAAANSMLAEGDVLGISWARGCGVASRLIQIDVSTSQRFSISGLDEFCAPLGAGPAIGLLGGVDVADDGTIYVTNYYVDYSATNWEGLSQLLVVDAATGNRTIVSGCTNIDPDSPNTCLGVTIGNGPDLLGMVDPRVVDLAGTTYIVGQAIVAGCPASSVVLIDPSSGAREVVSGYDETCGIVGNGPLFSEEPFTRSMDVSDDGFGIVGGERAIRVDLYTGNRTLLSGCTIINSETRECLGTTVGDGPVVDWYSAPAVVPEPALGMLLAAGIAMLIGIDSRRR